jgi:hypothetical protein
MENWKPIEGYEGLYSVSDHGRVRSEDRVVTTSNGRTQTCKGLVKSASLDGKGYPRVVLYKDNKQKHFTVHQLMMRAFVGPQKPGVQVRHKNGDRTDFRLDNLEYGTDSDNKYDAVKHGTHTNAAKTHCKRGHEFTPENTYLIHSKTSIGNPTILRACKTCKRRRSQG